jgi:hypothetical protein
MTVRMLLVDDGHERREVPLDGRLTVGRDPRCHISHPDPLLSRRHAEFVLDEQQVTIRDLGSRNGILVNGTKVPEQVLAPGDLVQLGHLQCVYVERALSAIAPDFSTATGAQTKAVAPAPAGPPRPVVRKPDRRRRAPVVLDSRGSDDPTFAPGVKQPARSEDLEDTRVSVSRSSILAAEAADASIAPAPNPNDGRILVSSDLLVQDIDDAALALLKVPAASLIGRPLGDLLGRRLEQIAGGDTRIQLSLVVDPPDDSGTMSVSIRTGAAGQP